MKFVRLSNIDPRKFGLSRNYNWMKASVSLFQAIYSILTLYATRGDQVTRYGYAAFGLKVAPYALVSVVNLIAHLILPEYPTRYVIETETLTRLRG